MEAQRGGEGGGRRRPLVLVDGKKRGRRGGTRPSSLSCTSRGRGRERLEVFGEKGRGTRSNLPVNSTTVARKEAG